MEPKETTTSPRLLRALYFCEGVTLWGQQAERW